MKTFYLTKAFEQPAVTKRSETGLAIELHPTKRTWGGALYRYAGKFEVKEDRGQKEWSLFICPEGAKIDPSFESDPLVAKCPEYDLKAQLSGERRDAVQAWLDKSDLGVTLPTHCTLRRVMGLIQKALRHTDGFMRSLE
jgi:hypothetical protein